MTEPPASDGPPPGARGSRAWRWQWWAGGAVVALVVVWAAMCALRLLQAQHDVHAGVSDAQRARAELSGTNLTNEIASPAVAAAARQFRHAHSLLDSAWLDPLRILPVVGRQVNSADDLAGAAAVVTTNGNTALDQVRQLLQAPHGEPAERAALTRQLAVVVDAFDRQVAKVTLGPNQGLIGPLARNHNTFARDLLQLRSGLTRAQGATSSLSELLNGSHTYLVLTANNAEMRAGSGMFLQAGTMTVDNGAVTLGTFHPTSEITLPTSVPVTGDLARLWGTAHPGAEWRNLALSPQFPPNAALAAQMWQARFGQHVDGVIVVDPIALAGILSVTGPVTVSGHSLDAANAVSYLTHDQYLGIDTTNPSPTQHYDVEGQLAKAVFHDVTGGGIDLNALVKVFDQAANGRHLLLWAADPGVESGWQAAGVGGSVGPDELLLAVLNQGADKLDPFLSVTSTVATATVKPNHQVDTRVTVTVTVANHTPAGQPPYIAGSAGSPPGNGTYVGAVALDMPGGAGAPGVTGASILEAAGPDGASYVVAAPVSVAPGGSVTLTFQFLLLGSHGELRVQPSARLGPVSWVAGPNRFTDATAHEVTW